MRRETGETELQMCVRHVAEQETRIARQEALIEREEEGWARLDLPRHATAIQAVYDPIVDVEPLKDLLTVLVWLVMSPVVTLMFGVALVPFSWPYLAALPILARLDLEKRAAAAEVEKRRTERAIDAFSAPYESHGSLSEEMQNL